MRITLLLAALLAVASGCDTIEPPAETGPVVQFGAASVNASEGQTAVDIPVTLTGADAGQTVVVEVLLAAASSTTSASDIGPFGTASGSNRVTSVTLTGPTDTKVVTIDVLADNDLEGPESVVFVLQRAQGATIGGTRQFQIDIGTPPISETRTRPDGDVVTVEGIVTGRFGRYTFLQDNTAGLSIFAFTDTNFGMADIAPGDRVQIQGTLSEFGARDGAGLGLKQISVSNSATATFSVLSRGNPLPPAQTVTVAQILANGEQYESERIRVTGLSIVGSGDVVFQAGGSAGNYTVSDGTGEMILRINGSSDSELGGQLIPQGKFTFVGALGQFGGAYQLTPLRTTDLQQP